MKKFWSKKYNYDLDPDEIFLDSSNLPSFDDQQFEGRIEKPISKPALKITGLCFGLILLLFGGKIYDLQIAKGQIYADRSQNNTLRYTTIFPERGLIYDRQGEVLAWNNPDRQYKQASGLAHLLGYVGRANQEELDAGAHPQQYLGKSGVEKMFNTYLSGQAGLRIEEVDATGNISSDHIIDQPSNGQALNLSIDARVQEALYEKIKAIATERDFSGGAGIIMDVLSGEIIALTSYPEYDPNIITSGQDKEKIKQFLNDKNLPFLNRCVAGLYTPGSTFKLIVAYGALMEKIIDPNKTIYSTGELRLPNPYHPGEYTVFKDWKAHGAVDLRRAIAVSSNVYFYQIGGGFGQQAGLGIGKIKTYAELFGLSDKSGLNFPGELAGTIPSPAWKAKNFAGEEWLLGNTYHTSIGQYGVSLTPLQIIRAVSTIANGGSLLTPTVVKQATSTPAKIARIIKSRNQADDPDAFQIIREGMRQAVTDGSITGLLMPEIAVAAKTGTAELGISKQRVNSWVTGFFPYHHPRYAFVVIMEKGSRDNLIGAVYVMRQMFEWLYAYAPDYVRPTATE